MATREPTPETGVSTDANESLVPMPRWRRRLFAIMSHADSPAATYFSLRECRVVRVEIIRNSDLPPHPPDDAESTGVAGARSEAAPL